MHGDGEQEKITLKFWKQPMIVILGKLDTVIFLKRGRHRNPVTFKIKFFVAVVNSFHL